MTRAEKDALMKQWQADRQEAPAPAVEIKPVSKPVIKTFEVDGKQIPYHAERPAKTDRSISNAWKEIAKNRD